MILKNPFKTKSSKPLVLDGAMGSYIQQKGILTDNVLWTTNINHNNPDLILKTHLEYIDAGADIITTNTFRTNPASLSKAGIDTAAEYVKEAVHLAKQASMGSKVITAGSNAPAEDCYQKERNLSNNELKENHKYHIDLLIDSGVDFVLNETQSHFDELKIICDHCDKNEIPYIVSLYVLDNFKILSGESLDNILSFLRDHGVIAISFNCISPNLFLNIIGSIQLPERWGYYLNCGSGLITDKIISCGIQTDDYLKFVEKSLEYKPVFIGSCCGSSPAHTKKIREYLDGQIYS
ncbi:MAG: homocysteine S-methyltransferase family protein [Ignavibacteriaceae bacterium]|nr:homocysteine S-methyltransferase family protein [Ignavibacteriaceae bacterium]